MASLRLDNIPDELVKRLELAAMARHREVADEVVDRLDDSFGPHRVADRPSAEELSQIARKIRGEIKNDWLTPEFLRTAREYGRE